MPPTIRRNRRLIAQKDLADRRISWHGLFASTGTRDHVQREVTKWAKSSTARESNSTELAGGVNGRKRGSSRNDRV